MEEKNPYNNIMDLAEPKLKVMIKQHISGITCKQAHSILRIVKTENVEEILNKAQFLEKVLSVYHKKLYVGDPFCKYCFKRFHNRKQMVAHVAVIHEGKKKKFVCEDCPSTFMSTKSLEYHKHVVHSETKEEVKCEICGAVFSHQVSLLRHKKIHEKVKPTIECKICHKTFGRIDSLTKHTKSVHGLNNSMNVYRMVRDLKNNNGKLKCVMCQTKFVGKNAEKDLETHISRRCQNFECENCKQAFSLKDNMKRHMKAHHSDQVNFSCDKCDYDTKYKFNLKKHKDKKHPE